MKSILDEIYTRILEAGRGFSEQEILRDFFKIELASDDMASRIVSPLLKGDARFVQGTDRAWSAVKKVSLEELPVSETPFILFAIDDLERRTPASSLHVFAREYAGEGPAAPDDMREAPIDREAVVPPDRMPNVEGDPFFLLKECSAFIVYKNGVVLSDISIRDVLKKAHQYVFLPHDAKSLARLKKVSRSISPLSPDLKTLSIRTLISLLYPEKRLKTWDDIVKEFSIVSLQSDRPGSRVLTLKYIFEFLLLALQSRGLRSSVISSSFNSGRQRRWTFPATVLTGRFYVISPRCRVSTSSATGAGE